MLSSTAPYSLQSTPFRLSFGSSRDSSAIKTMEEEVAVEEMAKEVTMAMDKHHQ